MRRPRLPAFGHCPICDRSVRLLHHRGRRGARCSRCGALERHRLLYLQLPDKLGRVLHVAPEPCLRGPIRARSTSYVTTDLAGRDVDVLADLCALPFPDNSFDTVICNHVLEHIPDDRQAIREMRRVGHTLITMHPVFEDEQTFEDPAITDPGERLRVYGQEDHVRRYGSDFPDRLRAEGFQVTQTGRGSEAVYVAV